MCCAQKVVVATTAMLLTDSRQQTQVQKMELKGRGIELAVGFLCLVTTLVTAKHGSCFLSFVSSHCWLGWAPHPACSVAVVS